MGEPSQFWLAQLDGELHECHLPKIRRGASHECECGCQWRALLGYRYGIGYGLRWMLAHDPDRKV